jgi:hypothetical protein
MLFERSNKISNVPGVVCVCGTQASVAASAPAG